MGQGGEEYPDPNVEGFNPCGRDTAVEMADVLPERDLPAERGVVRGAEGRGGNAVQDMQALAPDEMPPPGDGRDRARRDEDRNRNHGLHADHRRGKKRGCRRCTNTSERTTSSTRGPTGSRRPGEAHHRRSRRGPSVFSPGSLPGASGDIPSFQARLRNKSSNIVDIELNIFEKDGRAYRRRTEAFSERAYEPEELKELLGRAGA